VEYELHVVIEGYSHVMVHSIVKKGCAKVEMHEEQYPFAIQGILVSDQLLISNVPLFLSRE
jgi:thiamine biosynthesis protein ThiC